MSRFEARRVRARLALAKAATGGVEAEAERVAELAGPGGRVEIWAFEPQARRLAAEALLREAGVAGRVRPAWKAAREMLVEALGPAWGPGDSARITAPAAPGPHPGRFLRELYPLPPGVRARVGPVEGAAALRRGGLARFEASILRRRRRASTAEALSPVRPRPLPGGGGEALGACGWRRWARAGSDGWDGDEPWETPAETALFSALETLQEAGAFGPGPHFGALALRLDSDWEEIAAGGGLGRGLGEALHEELYFGALEVFRAAAGLAPDDRSLAPGAIVPEVMLARRSQVSVTATAPEATSGARAGGDGSGWLRRDASPRSAGRRGAAAKVSPPETWTRAPAAADVTATLEALGGLPLARVRSAQGRAVEARALRGRGAAVAITGGQHGNEPTGVVGALAAARRLAERDMPFGVAPLENPDGWALYEALRAAQPRWMHHAARYAATGADIAWRDDGEARIRAHLAEATGAALQISLHGYPAHEWARPFTGWLPRGFEDWSLPRGVFLILRAEAGWTGPGRAALRGAAAALNGDAELRAFNRAQIARFRAVAPEAPLTRIGDVPVIEEIGPRPRGPFPVVLITEMPDETVEGPLFRLLTRAQALAAMGAAKAWRRAVSAG